MAIREEVLLLREAEPFAGADVAHLQVLAFSAERFSVPAGEWIVRRGEASGAGWLIRSGEAEALEGSGPRRVARLGRGAFIGALSMVGKVPHRVDVRATSRVSGLRIPHDLFIRVCSEFPEFGQLVLANLGRRLSGSVAELERVRSLFQQARSFQQG